MHPYYGPGSILLQGGSTQWLGVLSMFAYLLFCAVVILIAFRWLKRLTPDGELFRKDMALIILRERYAKGEIGRQEFLEKQTDLSAGGLDLSESKTRPKTGSNTGSKSAVKTRARQELHAQAEPSFADPVRKPGGVS